MAKPKNKSNTPKFLLNLPYIKDIRASWISNQSHCDPDSPSRREHYIEKGINFCPEWLEDIGFIDYYLFHIRRGYIPKKSELQRIDQDKGFSPENCLIVQTNEDNNSVEKSTKPVIEAKITSPTKVTNNIFIIDRNVDINELIGNLCAQTGKN